MKITVINSALNTAHIVEWLDSKFDTPGGRENALAQRLLVDSPDIIAFSEFQRFSYEWDNDGRRIEGTRQDRAEIVANALRDEGYVCVFSTGKFVAHALNREGYICVFSTAKFSDEPNEPLDKDDWVLLCIAVKGNPEDIIEVDRRPHDRHADGFCGRKWLGITIKNNATRSFKNGELRIINVHVPYASDKVKRKNHFEAIYAELCVDGDAVLVGDFNAFDDKDIDKDIAGEIALSCKSELEPILDNGWVDAWEYTHKCKAPKDIDRFTYFFRRSGRRLDYAFLSPGLETQLCNAEHQHDYRLHNLTDHSALMIELE